MRILLFSVKAVLPLDVSVLRVSERGELPGSKPYAWVTDKDLADIDVIVASPAVAPLARRLNECIVRPIAFTSAAALQANEYVLTQPVEQSLAYLQELSNALPRPLVGPMGPLPAGAPPPPPSELGALINIFRR